MLYWGQFYVCAYVLKHTHMYSYTYCVSYNVYSCIIWHHVVHDRMSRNKMVNEWCQFFSILHQSWLLCAFCVMQTAESAPEQVSNCKSCGKQVFQMEQIKAERAVWHKNCFRCTECNKQLTWVPFRWCLGALELWQVVKIGSHVGICLEGWKFYLLYLNISSH